MNWIAAILKPLKKRIAVGITIKVIGTVVELFIPFLLSYILENVIETNHMGSIVFYGVLMALCALAACVGNIVANRMAAKTTMLFATRMRKELFAKTLHLTARSTDSFTIPSLESRITSDTYNVQTASKAFARAVKSAAVAVTPAVLITPVTVSGSGAGLGVGAGVGCTSSGVSTPLYNV